MIDYSNCRNITEIKTKLRADLVTEFFEFLVSRYGEENVSQISTNEIAFATGYTMVDTHEEEVCAIVKIIAKPWTDSMGEKRKTLAFDRYQAEADFKKEKEIKGEKN